MNALAGSGVRRWRGTALVMVAVAVVLAAWLWQGVPAPSAPGRMAPVRSPGPGVGVISPSPAQRPAVAAPSQVPVAIVAADANARDLRRVYDDYSGSADPRQRRMAARAFAACIPLFVPNADETPSPEPMIQSLPPGGRVEREQAFRSLFARCSRFLAERPETIAAMRDGLQRDAQAHEPASRAREALLAGQWDQVEPLVSDALNSADPAAVAALSGLTERLAQSRGAGTVDAGSLARARAVDAALPAVACDLGLDCGSQSLRALQLCALEGLCDGDVAARMQARYGQGAVAAAAVDAERTRLDALIRSGRPLTVADLLPQPEGR